MEERIIGKAEKPFRENMTILVMQSAPHKTLGIPVNSPE
jgi:hypothetical protein